MYGQDSTRPWGNGALDLLDIYGVRSGCDIDKNRTGPYIGDSPRSGDKSHRDRDYFVSWAHSTSDKGQVQRTGSRIHPDTVAYPTVARECSFKSRYCGPRSKDALLEHVVYSGMHLIANRCVLVLEIDKG